MNHKAHDICNSIILFVKIFKELEPSKFWLSAVKAAQIQSVQLCNAKEFDAALLLLNKVGQMITQQVSNRFLPCEKEDKSQTLQNNYYSFNFRRYKAQYHILFNDFKNAELLLRELLQDELAYYSNNRIKADNAEEPG